MSAPRGSSALAAALMLVACGASTTPPSPRPSVAPAATARGGASPIISIRGETGMERDWASGGCAQPAPAPAYVGQDAEAAAAALGRPSGEERFKLGEGVNEFRVELRNEFPLPANADLTVLERTWSAGDCRLTLWAVERDGGWKVVHAMRWPVGAEF